MAGLLRRVVLFLALFAFTPLAVQAAPLDDYYLSRFHAHKVSHQRAALATAAVPTAEDLAERCLTPLYRGLKRDWKSLSAETQKILAKDLAKPSVEDFPESFTSAHFKIHYTTIGPDAPPLADVSGISGVPDWVETVAAEFEFVYDRVTGGTAGALGYNPAPTLPGAFYDVYLQNLDTAFGWTDPDPPPPGQISSRSYIIIDNDFKEDIYRNYKGIKGLQITAAHEYHHAIQFGYNYYFDIWFAEATATWIEDEVYDDINQLYDYLPAYLRNSALSLDTPVNRSTGGGYGRWIFNRPWRSGPRDRAS